MALDPHFFIDWATTQTECYNLKYFDGELLVKVALRARSSKRIYAQYNTAIQTIEFFPCCLAAELSELEIIICHELLHAAQKQLLGIKPDHGASFRKLGLQVGMPVECYQTHAPAALMRRPRAMR